jgi:ABC-type phosphate transport system substrate-binding protein
MTAVARRLLACVFPLTVLVPLASSDVAAQVPEFKIVAHASVPGAVISRQTLAAIFLGVLSRWSDGKAIVPVDQSATSPGRAQFAEKALGMSTLAVNHHWMNQIRSGRRPPIVKKSDGEVIAFVAANAGAVGYVSAAEALPETVKLLEMK